jgi:hypothetical protein
VVVVPRSEVDAVTVRLDEVRSAESNFEADAAKGLRVPDFMQAILQSKSVLYLD